MITGLFFLVCGLLGAAAVGLFVEWVLLWFCPPIHDDEGMSL